MSHDAKRGHLPPRLNLTQQTGMGQQSGPEAVRIGIPSAQMRNLQPVPLYQLHHIPGGRQFHQVAPPALQPAALFQGTAQLPVTQQPIFMIRPYSSGVPPYPRSGTAMMPYPSYPISYQMMPQASSIRPMAVQPTPLVLPTMNHQYVNSAQQVVILRGAIPPPSPVTNVAPMFRFPPPATRSGMLIPLLPGTPTTTSHSATPGNLPAIRRPSQGDTSAEDIVRPSNPATPSNTMKLEDRIRKLPLARQMNVTVTEASRAPTFRQMNRSLPQIVETLPGGEVSLTRSQRLHLEWDLSPIGSTDSTTCHQNQSALSDIPEVSESESPSNNMPIKF